MIFLKRFKYYTKQFISLTDISLDNYVILDNYNIINSLEHGYKTHAFGYNKNMNITIIYKIYDYIVEYITIKPDGRVQYLDIAKLFKSGKLPVTVFTFSDYTSKCVIKFNNRRTTIKTSFGNIIKDASESIYEFKEPMYIKI